MAFLGSLRQSLKVSRAMVAAGGVSRSALAQKQPLLAQAHNLLVKQNPSFIISRDFSSLPTPTKGNEIWEWCRTRVENINEIQLDNQIWEHVFDFTKECLMIGGMVSSSLTLMLIAVFVFEKKSPTKLTGPIPSEIEMKMSTLRSFMRSFDKSDSFNIMILQTTDVVAFMLTVAEKLDVALYLLVVKAILMSLHGHLSSLMFPKKFLDELVDDIERFYTGKQTGEFIVSADKIATHVILKGNVERPQSIYVEGSLLVVVGVKVGAKETHNLYCQIPVKKYSRKHSEFVLTKYGGLSIWLPIVQNEDFSPVDWRFEVNEKN